MKQNLITWLFYDAGNSFLQVAIGGLFLAQWVVIDNGFEDIWYGGTFSAATILVLLLAPILGSWSDRIGKRLPFIRYLTIIMYLLNIGLVLVMMSGASAHNKVIFVLILFLLLQTLYQLSLVPYSSLINKISTKETVGKITGMGEAANAIGWIVATALLMPFALGTIAPIGTGDRSEVFFPAVFGFSILTLPLILFFKEKESLKIQSTVKEVYLDTINGIKGLFRENKNIGIFLLGFMFITDAILTIQLYFAILMDRVYGIDDKQKIYMLLLMYVVLIASSYIFGIICDKYGAKRVLILSSLLIAIVFSVAFGFSTPWILYVVGIFAGIGWGGFYTSARTLLVNISPKEKLGEYFGLYTTFQRFSSIMGPLLWGGVILILSSYPILKYRVAGYSLVALMLIGILVVSRVKEEKTELM